MNSISRTAAVLIASVQLSAGIAAAQGAVGTEQRTRLQEQRAPARWAVIVGVSDYEHFGDGIGGDLPGAALDARAMHDVLVERWSLPAANVRLLLDGDATRDRIRTAVSEWLPSVVQPGDIALFYFSGHGSQAWDLDSDEDDGLDETIAPHDALPASTDRDIIDDELREWLAQIGSDHVVVILDNCHAGTGTRAPTVHARPRTLARDVASLPRPPALQRPARTRSGRTQLLDGTVLELAAAQAGEVAVEVAWPQDHGGTIWGGAFTTLLVQQLRAAAPGITYLELFRRTRNDMRRAGFTQDPRITEPRAALAVLAVDATPSGAAPPSSARYGVDRTSGHRAYLAGAARLPLGAVLAAGSETLLQVGSASGSEAVAVVIQGRTPSLGDTVTLIAITPPARTLRVHSGELSARTRAALEPLIENVTVVSEPDALVEPGDLVLRSAAGGFDIIGFDGAVRHQLRAQPDDVMQLVAAALRREADARQLAVLDNPADPFSLELSLASNGTSLTIGAPVELEVRSTRNGYLTLVDLGTDGTVAVLFPGAAAGGAVRAGELVTIPTPAMRAAGETFIAQPPAGAGILRAFVTASPLDLPVDDTIDGTGIDAATVLRALRTAAGTADGRLNAELLPLNGWTTAVLHYRVVK